MVAYEHQLRMSSWAQSLYAAYDYDFVTKSCIQEQAVCYYVPIEKDQDLWRERLRDAPHLLGIAAAQISHYIAGSFASFRDPHRTLQVGELLCSGPQAVDRLGHTHHWTCEDLLAAPITVVLCGSAT